MQQMIEELQALNRYRLDKDLTYQQLSERVGVPYRTLHTLLTSDTATPFDRTLHKIRRFLDKRGLLGKAAAAR